MKKISSKTVISKVIRDFGIKDSDWQIDAIEWIGEAIEFIGHHFGFVKTEVELTITDYRALLPTDFYNVVSNGVVYEDITLPYGDGQAIYESSDAFYITKSTMIEDGETIELEWNERLATASTVGEYYTLNDNYLITSFEAGTVDFTYYAFPIDSSGFLTIPDNVYYKEAISWYVMKQLIKQGRKHPIFSYEYANANWEKSCTRAANDVAYPIPDKFKTFIKRWTLNLNKE